MADPDDIFLDEERTTVATFLDVPERIVRGVEVMAALKLRSTERLDATTRTLRVSWSGDRVQGASARLEQIRNTLTAGPGPFTVAIDGTDLDTIQIALDALRACGAVQEGERS